MSRRQKLKTVKNTGHPNIDNAIRNVWRRFNADLVDPTVGPWFYFHVGLPRKQKKYMKKISMRMNLIRYITGISQESN